MTFSSMTDWALSRQTQGCLESVGADVLRIAFGLALFGFHGVHKLVDGVKFRRGQSKGWPFADEIVAARFPFPEPMAWLAAFAQLGGGLFLVLGLLTRPAALVIIGTLLGAVYTNVVLRKDNQLALLYLAAIVAILLQGAGPGSLDSLLFR